MARDKHYVIWWDGDHRTRDRLREQRTFAKAKDAAAEIRSLAQRVRPVSEDAFIRWEERGRDTIHHGAYRGLGIGAGGIVWDWSGNATTAKKYGLSPQVFDPSKVRHAPAPARPLPADHPGHRSPEQLQAEVDQAVRDVNRALGYRDSAGRFRLEGLYKSTSAMARSRAYDELQRNQLEGAAHKAKAHLLARGTAGDDFERYLEREGHRGDVKASADKAHDKLLRQFADKVQDAAASPEVRNYHGKAFVGSLFDLLHARSPHAFPSRGDFKDRLVEAHRAGLLELGRADLVSAMDPADVRDSEIAHLNSTFHFVLPTRAQRKGAENAAPPGPGGAAPPAREPPPGRGRAEGRGGGGDPEARARVLAAVRELGSNGALVLARDARPLAGLSKEDFDRAALELGRSRELILHQHDHVGVLGPEKRAELVYDPKGPRFFVGLALPQSALVAGSSGVAPLPKFRLSKPPKLPALDSAPEGKTMAKPAKKKRAGKKAHKRAGKKARKHAGKKARKHAGKKARKSHGLARWECEGPVKRGCGGKARVVSLRVPRVKASIFTRI